MYFMTGFYECSTFDETLSSKTLEDIIFGVKYKVRSKGTELKLLNSTKTPISGLTKYAWTPNNTL